MSLASFASARISRWQITTAPKGWLFVPDFGLRHDTPGFASNIHLGGDELLAGDRLQPYIEAQQTMLGRIYDNPVFAGPQPAQRFADRADEAMLLLIRHQPMRGTTVTQVQTYARVGKWIGIVTLTTTDRTLRQVRPDLQSFLASLTIVD